jgi:hypothetical protein
MKTAKTRRQISVSNGGRTREKRVEKDVRSWASTAAERRVGACPPAVPGTNPVANAIGRESQDEQPRARSIQVNEVRSGWERLPGLQLTKSGMIEICLREAVRQMPSWLLSMVVHLTVFLALALITLPARSSEDVRDLVVAPGEYEALEVLDELDDEPLIELDLDLGPTDIVSAQPKPQRGDIGNSVADDIQSAAVAVELAGFGLESAPRNDLLATVGAFTGNALSGRGASARGRAIAAGGGSAGSEKAVAAALKWLAGHQLSDGGWSFDHTRARRCVGQCRNPGALSEARIAATGLALLPLLGAGQTHKEGIYMETVKNGLYFLIAHMKVGPKGGALNESRGRMYAQGIASIALCEAYAMTGDKGLYAPAQQAIGFICYAQDPIGGGWRYEPRQRGDTSVVGWQIMALKSGHMAYLSVPPITVKKASVFLDGVQSDSGANYGYVERGSGSQATTAIGLLCRMYLGWNKENPALQRGVQQISRWGPSKGNMYYNYYATQVMRHWEGDLWEKWNSIMRDQLIQSQATQGHEAGSWFFRGGDLGSERGGRLYCTAMATMVLEVYYRHLPIYRKQSTEEDFPLD